MLYYTNLRYDMMPYLYSLAGMTHFNDYTIMRPMVMDFTADKATRNIGDQYMFGPAFLVAPVYTYGATSRDVYFPAGSVWYDFYTGAVTDGGQTKKVAAPYERIPLYVRSGSIVPFGPAMQWSDEKPAEEINLYVYAGEDGDFTLYEDENTNYNYEKGQFAMIPFHWNDKTQTLAIGERTGQYPGMIRNRKFNIIKVSKDHPVGYARDNKGVTVAYNGEAKSIKL